MNAVYQLYLSMLTSYMNGNMNDVAAPTCSMKDLVRETPDWDFRWKLTCNINGVRKFINVYGGEATGNVPVGRECIYEYVCAMDVSNSMRKVALTCGSNRKWSGALPSCSMENHMADKILDVYDAISQRQNVPSPTTRPTPATTEASSTVRYARFRTLCEAQKMCSTLSSPNECHRIVPRGINGRLHPKLFKFHIALCGICFKVYCTNSVTLL